MQSLPGILVTGGKGGVGKSTIAAGISRALARRGAKIGLVDADLMGPSQAILFNIDRLDARNELILPSVRDGVSVVSLGSVALGSSPLVWNTLSIRGALQQLIKQVHWGDVELLIVDTPPGTSEVHLSADEFLARSGVLFVTTSSPLALADCRRSISIAIRKELHIIGLVENMTGMICEKCENFRRLFPEKGLQNLSHETKVPIIAQIPWIDNIMLAPQFDNLALHCEAWLKGLTCETSN